MKEQLAALYELQGIDIQMAKVKAGLAALDGAKMLRAKLAAAKKQADAVEAELSALETELKDSELKLKSIDEKRATYEKRLYGGGISNPKELAAMEKEINMLKQQQEQLDGRTLELYDIVEGAREKARKAKALQDKIEKQVAEAVSAESSKRTAFEGELAELEAKREEAAARVTDKALMARYQSLTRQPGSTGIAKVVDHRCEGCRVSVTEFTIRKLFEGKEYERCENCGRILFLELK